MKTLGEMGEHDAIRRLVERLGYHADLSVGAGDDCAVAHSPGSDFDQVFTSDPVIEHVHFLPTHAPERIGNKAVGRVLSDMAAMGAHPQWILVNVVAPPELEMAFLEGIYAGMTALCGRFGATIIGGDLAQGRQLELHLFGTGILPAGTALLRSGACAGDLIFVSGPLGCSMEGHHLDFVPRVEEGLFLRECTGVGAVMDLSDGLTTDLRHILAQSGVGAELEVERIPKNGTLEQALYDGEDYELLFTLQPDSAEGLIEDWAERFGTPPACIGRITSQPDKLNLCFPDGRVSELFDKAFEHFSSGRA
ncbi:MAG: thiamine-monophosphate kinase [Pontiellaceae bacterium]|nr:thiamine-monophosphate kinase [Pontiellaceae bacterium]